MSTQSPLIEAKSVTIKQGRKDILTIPQLNSAGPSLILLQGNNGSGKTTFLRALANEASFTGSLKVAGQTVGSLAMKQRSFFVPTDPILPDDLFVAEYIAFVSLAYGVDPQVSLAVADDLNLTPWLESSPHELSRGTRQKVALAAALGISRPVTLLDEPLANLDHDSVTTCLHYIKTERIKGNSLIISDHSGHIRTIADAIWTLSGGEILADQEIRCA